MPYLTITANGDQIHKGPTKLGDDHLYSNEFSHLNPYLSKENNGIFYQVDKPPRVVLNELDLIGYKVVGCASNSNIVIWTLYRPSF